MKKNVSNAFFLRLVLCGMASYVLTFYNEDVGFFEAIVTVPYLRAFIASFVIAFILVEYIYRTTVRLDRQLNWQEERVWRMFWQLVMGFVIPALAAFVLAAGFFALFGHNILETNYLRHDYTLILLMLAFFNLCTLLMVSFLPKSVAPAVHLLSDQRNQENGTRQERETVLVETAIRSIKVPVSQIHYAFILQGNVFIRTTDTNSLSDSLPYQDTLRTLQEQLDSRQFFRINRQMLINFATCSSFRSNGNRTVEVLLDPAPYPTGLKVSKEHERLCTVSEDRVAAFKLWMDR